MSTPTDDKKLSIKQRLAAAHAGLTAGANDATKLSALQAEHTTAVAEIERLTAALAGAEKLVTERTAEVKTLTEKVTELTGTVAARDKSLSEVTAERDGLKANVGAAVTARLAEMGIKPEDAPKTQEKPGVNTREEHLKEYNRLLADGKSGAAGEYYNANLR